MKKVVALILTTALCVSVFLPVLVHGKKSAPTVAPAQSGPEQVQSGPEVQIGQQAVSVRVREMVKGKDKGKHLSPDKDYRNVFNTHGLTKSGYVIDPVVQTSGPNNSQRPLMLPAP